MPVLSQGFISPVLEPVKRSADNLGRALHLFITNDINFTLIVNPGDGDFAKDASEL